MRIMTPGVGTCTTVNNVVAVPKIESAVSENVTRDLLLVLLLMFFKVLAVCLGTDMTFSSTRMFNL